ncbi:hypothetical protein GCM10009591_11320 [Brachybacterium tyrofermentans]
MIILRAVSAEGLEAITSLVTSKGGLTVLGNTVKLGLTAATIGTVIGFCHAYVQVFLSVRGKRVAHVIALTPLISPPFALATAILALFGRSGLVNDWFGLALNIYGFPGLVLVLALSFSPVAYLNLKGLMQSLDPSLIEAGASLGAGRFRVLWRVTLPLLIPGILSSFLLLFVESIADLANPLVLGGSYRVLATEIYYSVTGSFSLPVAAGYSVALLAPALIAFSVQKYWVARHNVVTVTGKSGSATRGRESALVAAPVATLSFAALGLTIVIYGIIVVGAFTTLLGIDNSFTLDNFTAIFRGGAWRSFLITVMMAVVSAPIAATLGVVIAWLVVRKWRSKAASTALDFTGMLGTAVPGTVLGIGAALAYSAPINLFGRELVPQLAGSAAPLAGALAIVLVYIARGISSGQQTSIAALGQISPSIEEAAASLGAGGGKTFLSVSLPLIRPAVVGGLTYAITRSMTVMTAIIFIVSPQTQVVTARTLQEVSTGRYGNAFAYVFILIVVVLALMGIAHLLTSWLFAPRSRAASHAPSGTTLQRKEP